MLRPLAKPGLFVTGTDTGVGKTIVAAALADYFHRRGLRVGVFKPVASGCGTRETDGAIVSEDAQMLGAVIGHRFDHDTICPFCYSEALAPALAAKRSGRAVVWAQVQAALDRITADSDVVIVEGAGGLHVPLDQRTLVLDLIRALRMPTLCVSRPGLGTINQTLMTVDALLAARVECAGVVINRYPLQPDIVEQTNIGEIERWGGVRVRCAVPESYFVGFRIPQEIAAVIDKVDWSRLARC